jgi:Thiamine monophosphate synthase
LARGASRLAAAARSNLPVLILMTDDARLTAPVAAAKALPRGSAVVVRAQNPEKRRALALRLRPVAIERGLFLLIAGDEALAKAIGADGVHLPEAHLGEAASIRARTGLMITASAHSLAALRKARFVDALILSAVFPTESHAGRASLSPVRANLLARQIPKPVFALGGITARNTARLSGFCGIAAIGALKA